MNQNTGYPYSVTLRHTKTSRSGYYAYHPKSSYDIEHYQVPGAKHGVRRYQNKDGSLTPLGRIHYGIGPARDSKVIDADNALRAEKKAEKRAARDAERSEKAAEKKAKQDAIAAEKKAKQDADAAEKADMKRRTKAAEKNKYMREHPELMSNDELKADTERARLETQREETLRNLNRVKSENDKKESKETKNHKDYLSKSKKQMTNEELQEAAERINAEKRYEDAVRELKQARHPFAKKLLKEVGTTVVTALAQKGAEKLANKIFGDHSEVAKLKKQKEALELKQQINELSGKKSKDSESSDLMSRIEKSGLKRDPSNKETDAIDKDISKNKKDLDAKKDKLDKAQSDLQKVKDALEGYNERRKTEIAEDTKKLQDFIKEGKEGTIEAGVLVRKMLEDSDKAYEQRNKYKADIDKLTESVNTAQTNFNDVQSIITNLTNKREEAAKRAISSITDNPYEMFRGMSPKDVESAKNMLIDMKQAVYLANEVFGQGRKDGVNTDSFNFTNHFGTNNGGKNGGNNGGNGGDNDGSNGGDGGNNGGKKKKRKK